jgi:hypothetical protein
MKYKKMKLFLERPCYYYYLLLLMRRRQNRISILDLEVQEFLFPSFTNLSGFPTAITPSN